MLNVLYADGREVPNGKRCFIFPHGLEIGSDRVVKSNGRYVEVRSVHFKLFVFCAFYSCIDIYLEVVFAFSFHTFVLIVLVVCGLKLW